MFPIDLLQTFTKKLARPFPWSRPTQPIALTPSAAALASGGQVLAKRTTLTRTQAKAALKTAMTSVLGRAPTPAELKMLVAQSDLETRTWKAMWNWNFGNATVGKAPAAWFTIPGTDASHRFRAFGSTQEGAQFFVNLLQHRYPEAWALLDSEDVLSFSQALKVHGYYEGTAENYASGLAARYALA